MPAVLKKSHQVENLNGKPDPAKKQIQIVGEKATLEGAGEAHTKITCTSVSNSGEYTNGTEYKITVTFLGCESGGINVEHGYAGRIGTNPLRANTGSSKH